MKKRGNLELLNLHYIPPDALSPEQQLRNAISDADIEPPEQIVMDGRLHRFSASGRPHDDAGWYIAFGDGVPAGSFGSWASGVAMNWVARVGRDLTPIEMANNSRRMAEARALREAEAARKHAAAEQSAETIWTGAAQASDDHPYLAKKGVRAHDLRVTGDGRLVVPMRDRDGNLLSLQFIAGDGDKRYLAGGAAKGCMMILGDLGPRIYVAEGYATAATIYEQTGGQPTVVAFSAGNLPATVEALRVSWPASEIVIVADHDVSGTGKRYADEAAKLGARVVMPPVPGDANDYWLAGHDLLALINPPRQDWLVPADEFRAQPAPIRWLIKRWLQRDALIMIHGPSGGGKTFVALDMLLHLAAGKTDWHGQIARPASIVYLAGEGHYGLRARIAAWCDVHKASALRMHVSRSGCDLNTTEGYARARDAIRALGDAPALICVDTLHRFLAGDENSAQDAKTMLDACSCLMREFGASVILVHHTGLSEEAQHRARGSSAWRGALDIEISVVPGETIQLIQRKAKDAELAEPLYFQLVSRSIPGWTDEDGQPVTSAVLQQAEAPPAATKSSKHERFASYIDRAWWLSGAELDEQGRPYIAKAALLHFLVTSLEMAESTAKKWLKPSVADGMISHLLLGKIVTPEANGWSVVDPALASSLLIRKGEHEE